MSLRSPALHGATAVGGLLASAMSIAAQEVTPTLGMSQREVVHVGWGGFSDVPFILDSLGALLLATVLGAIIGFHPAAMRRVDTLRKGELPKVHVLYAVVGAVIGVTVLKYGLGVGVVMFGLGGLIRFRTDAGSTADTGQLILVTLVGLTSGLGLPHFAVLTTLFAYGLIHLLDARPVCRLVVKEIPPGRVAESAEKYRAALLHEGCGILSERRGFAKQHVAFVVRVRPRTMLEALHERVFMAVPAEVRGEADWEVE